MTTRTKKRDEVVVEFEEEEIDEEIEEEYY